MVKFSIYLNRRVFVMYGSLKYLRIPVLEFEQGLFDYLIHYENMPIQIY